MLKILHITNEITKKNFSISSLIEFITNNGNEKNLFKSEVLCSDTEDLAPVNKPNLLTKKIKWKNFFELKRIFLNKVIDYDVIHIHGMWAPIQLYSIILCLIYSKKTIIHPHGMLLREAINENGFLKKIYKKICLYVLKVIFYNQKNIIFIAITNDEFNQIRELFSDIEIELIQNNIPFENFNLEKTQKINYRKTFVFFGRIHPHKNIIEMINFFINSHLIEKGWELEIYGIKDDNNYLNKINKYISNYPEIKILDPVFGSSKAKIIKHSWANILISKSEVLSFSVLESGIYGLPSIVTNNIETLEEDIYSQKVTDNSSNVLKKIQEVSDWSIQKRQTIGQNTSLFFNEYKKQVIKFY